MKKVSLMRFYILAFVQMVAANFVHPVTPTFLSNLNMPDYMFGAALAAMSLGTFLLCGLWGSVSDKYGRVIVMSVGVVGYGIAQVFFLHSDTVGEILMARFLGGSFSSAVTVCMMAYLADISEPSKCSRNMAWYAAVTAGGKPLGYTLGGIVGDVSVAASFWIQSATLILCGVLFYSFFAESKTFVPKDVNWRKAVNPFSPFSLKGNKLSRATMVFLGVVFISCFATTAFDSAFNYYIQDQFGFPPSYNGYIYAAFGVICFAVNTTITTWLQQNTNCRSSIIFVFFGCGAMLLWAVSLEAVIPFVLVNVLFYAFNSMYLPIQQSLAFESRDGSNGFVSGLFLSVLAVGMVAGSLSAGMMYEQAPLLPFYAIVVAFLLCVILSVVNLKQSQRSVSDKN